jgi:hypothetical protein
MTEHGSHGALWIFRHFSVPDKRGGSVSSRLRRPLLDEPAVAHVSFSHQRVAGWPRLRFGCLGSAGTRGIDRNPARS